jgi:protein SCO1/2
MSAFSRRACLICGLGITLFPAGCKTKASLAEALPELGKVNDFSLENQAGKPVTAASLQGHVWVAAFFFSRCPTVCPKIMKRLARIQQTVKEKRVDLRLVALSVDPEFDRPKVLEEFGKRYGADFATWTFLTGDSAAIQHTVEKGFKVGLAGEIDERKEHLGITHGSHLVLVDSALQIRGYYRTSDEARMRELLTHADWLVRAQG